MVRQPPDGFRAGLDAVMLAAAIPALSGEEVLELGAGVGTASLCLARRVAGVLAAGIEIELNLVDIAAANVEANGMAGRVGFTLGDALDLPAAMRRPYAHVFCNPPFHDGGQVSPDAARARALSDGGRLADWIKAGLKRTVSGGSFTAILRADRLGEALAALPKHGIAVFPLWPRAGVAAKRVIVQAINGSRAPLALLPGLTLHQEDGRSTFEAEAVLRDGKGLLLRD